MPASGPGRQEAQVAADLEQADRAGLEDARDLHEHVGVLGGLDQVLGSGEADAGEVAQRVHHPEDELPRRGQAGAHGGAAQVDHAQPLLALVDAPAVAAEGLGVGAHLAAQGDEHGVLHLGAGHLDHVGVALLQFLEGLLQGHHLVLRGGGAGVMAARRRAVG